MSSGFRFREAWRSGVSHAVVLAAVAAISLPAQGQAFKVRPQPVRPSPEYVFPGGTLTVTATPAIVNFALVPNGIAQGSSGVTITTSWNLLGISPTLNLYGFFTTASAALSDNYQHPDLIPSSAVLGQMTTGVPAAFTPFTQTTPFGGAGAGLILLNTVPGFITTTGSRTDVLNLEINLSGVPALPAGTYTGTLTLQATMN